MQGRDKCERERFHSLDGLRGIACCVIAFFWHYLNAAASHDADGLPFYNLFFLFYKYGQYFVELFFMISGFVMMQAYGKKIQDGMDFSQYMLRRYRHIWPIAVVTLIVTAVLQFVYFSLYDSFYVYNCDLFHFILNLGLVQCGWFDTVQSFNGPSWCISVEIACYILLYFVVKAAKKNRKKLAGISFAVLLFVIYALSLNTGYPMINSFMSRGIGSFMIGVLMFCGYEYFSDRIKSRCVTLYGLVVVWFIAECLFYDVGFSTFAGGISVQTFFMVIICPFLIAAALQIDSIRILFSAKPFVKLGDLSLDVYLWHIPVQLLFKISAKYVEIDFSSGLIWGCYLVSVLSAAFLSNTIRKQKFQIKKAMAGICVLAVFQMSVRFLGQDIVHILNDNVEWDGASSITEVNANKINRPFILQEEAAVESVSICPITWDYHYEEDVIYIEIVSSGLEQAVFQKEIDCNAFGNGAAYTLDLGSNGLRLSAGKYVLVIYTSLDKEELPFAFKNNEAGNIAVKITARK